MTAQVSSQSNVNQPFSGAPTSLPQPSFLQMPAPNFGQNSYPQYSTQQNTYSQQQSFHQSQPTNVNQHNSVQQQLNTQQNESMLNTTIFQVVDPSVYVYSNGEINWFAVNQNIPLQCYPKITKNILSMKFTDMKEFFDTKPFEFYTLQDLKMQQPIVPVQVKTSAQNRIKQNNTNATRDQEFPAQTDNRSTKLHDITFCHAPLVPAKQLIKQRKSKCLPITPISNYDLSHIKFSGKISDDVWCKLHDLECKELRLKHFYSKDPILQSNTTKLHITSGKSNSFDIEQKQSLETFDSIHQTKSALKVLIEAQQAVWPLNKSMVIVDIFITNKGDFCRDLKERLNITSPLATARFIERFVDSILIENAIRISNDEDIFDLDTLETKYQNTIASFEIKDVLNQAVLEEKIKEDQRKEDFDKINRNTYSHSTPNKSFRQNNENSSPPSGKTILYKSICREFNFGSCSRQASYDHTSNTCKLNNLTRLQHICNHTKPNKRLCLDREHNATFHKPQNKNSQNKK